MMRFFLLCSTILTFVGCIGINAGTHGSIKRYRYDTSKYALEKAIHNIITGNNIVYQDSAKGYYNDDTSYITLDIPEGDYIHKYTFRFYEDKDYWDTSKTSEVFIAILHTYMRDGSSAPAEQYNASVKKVLTQRFERTFILKIDSALGMKHMEAE